MLNLNSLNPEQRAAVESIEGPLLILAGAGTGKTRVITFRIARMIARRIPPDEILGVTFTNKAAREMQERVRQLVPKPKRTAADRDKPREKQSRPTICTFHSLCVRILRRHIDRLGYKRNFVIYSESDQLGALRRLLSQFNATGEKLSPPEILQCISRLKNAGAGTGAAPDGSSDGETTVMDRLRARYDSALKACNAVDFDDLILLTLRLFREVPDALEECRNRYRYVMVDEYQDTNLAQFELVHALTRAHRNLCVVGDDDQSIYGWRGAEIANLLNLEQHFPEVKVVKLEQNYRSTSVILNAANAVIQNNVRRRGKQLWSRKGVGEKIVIHTFQTDEEEARVIAETIEYRRIGHRVPWADHAILFRTNQQSRPIEMALRQAHIRYHLIGGQSFFDRREIRDLMAYMKVLFNPDDDISLLRIANIPARGLSDGTMQRLLTLSEERKTSVFACLKHTDVLEQFPTRTQHRINDFVHWLERTRHPLRAPIDPGTTRPLQEWTNHFLNDIGYRDELRRMEKNPETADTRVRCLDDIVASFDDGPTGSTLEERLQNLLSNLTLDQDRNEDQERVGDAVTLITMHSCKGLEFPHVFVAGLEDGLLPHTRSKLEGTLDEERRLFYVAITRAMKTLSLCHCESRKKYGQLTPCHPSPFLAELPESLVEHADEMGKEPVSVDTGKSLFDGLRSAID